MHWLHRLTTLARVVDLRYRSNRAISFVTLVAAALGWSGLGALNGGPSDALALGGASFLAWAIGRQLDLAALIGLGVMLGTRPGGWPVGLVLAFAIARDRTLPGEPGRFSRLTALVVASGATGVAIASGVGAWRTPSIGEWSLAGVGIVAGLLIRPVQPLSPTDVGGLVLIGRRLASARRVTLAALAAVVLLAGGSGIVAAGSAFAAVLAVAAVQWRLIPVGAGVRSAAAERRE